MLVEVPQRTSHLIFAPRTHPANAHGRFNRVVSHGKTNKPESEEAVVVQRKSAGSLMKYCVACQLRLRHPRDGNILLQDSGSAIAATTLSGLPVASGRIDHRGCREGADNVRFQLSSRVHPCDGCNAYRGHRASATHQVSSLPRSARRPTSQDGHSCSAKRVSCRFE